MTIFSHIHHLNCLLYKFLALFPGIRQYSFGNSVVNLYVFWSPYKVLAPLPGIGAVHFLSLEVDILKNG